MEEHEQRAQRLAKLQELRARGTDPYAIERYNRNASTAQILLEYDRLERLGKVHDSPDGSVLLHQTDELAGAPARFAGRVVALRNMGRASFAHLLDEAGRIQVYARRDILGEQAYADFTNLDIGDIIGLEGPVFRTRSGEITVRIERYELLAKCLRPLPIGKEREGEHYAGLHDVELRYRMRYVDLLANPEAREVLVKRMRLVQAIRRFLDEKGFLEVETPVLQVDAGGAAARPFKTHHNALDYDFKLRISLELYLKRLIVGGFEKIYELGRVFRNEGLSTRHSPEFTLLELYQAFANLEDIEDLVEEMYVAACMAVNGSPRFTHTGPDGAQIEVDFSKRPWARIPILEGIRCHAGVKPEELSSLASAKRACRRVGIPAGGEHTVGGIVEKLHERFTQPHLIQPVFVTDFPIETSPLAKKRPDNPALTRRFEVYAAAQELGNAFSEINDPLDQRERFENQLTQRAAGDEEAHPMDEDFIRALEYGMPPTGGLGIGIDRLAMVLTGAQSIRDVILFPLLRPERTQV